MNLEHIEQLANIMKAYGLTAVDVKDGNYRVRIERGAQPVSVGLPTHLPANGPQTADEKHYNIQQSVNPLLEYIDVKSPIVGVFYTASSPDAEPFVSIGTRVRQGDVLCIIEAMKLLNEITADTDGEIADICLKNGDIAEYGQVLFKMTKV
jgi:acetyl-CoA carboxylase biotin carboxyl carrier protein